MTDAGSETAAKNALLRRITKLTPKATNEIQARAVLNLAEAYAWIESPIQAHGGNQAKDS